jgi:hypothetical protein
MCTSCASPVFIITPNGPVGKKTGMGPDMNSITSFPHAGLPGVPPEPAGKDRSGTIAGTKSLGYSRRFLVEGTHGLKEPLHETAQRSRIDRICGNA